MSYQETRSAGSIQTRLKGSDMLRFKRYEPGNIVRVVHANDAGAYIHKNFVGKTGMLVKNLNEVDGVTSSKNIWSVLIDGKIVHLHVLDFVEISELKDDE